jgi:hypothetical protein
MHFFFLDSLGFARSPTTTIEWGVFSRTFIDKPWLTNEGGGGGNAIFLEIVLEETLPISYISTLVEGWFEKKLEFKTWR